MKKYLLLLSVLALIALSCGDRFDEWGYVNFYIEPDSTEYYNLNEGFRGWEYMEGGNRGIIIFRNSHYEFMAYERSCVVKGCKGRLAVEKENNVLIYCPECKHQWLGVDGSPLEEQYQSKKKSKSLRMLYYYCTYYDGWRLFVRNCNG